MAVLSQIEPQRVFHFFEEISAIPRGSRHTRAISDWLAAFAEKRNLRVIQDKAGNIIIFKKASPGYEQAAPVILQGHMDMVCDKVPSCTKDMEREGLDLVRDGDTIYAKGTTLGGDDGIAVAMGLALLDDDEIPHPPLEIIYTIDEEIGMVGAAALDVSPLKGRRMINLDSEDEGIFTVSCAGGVDLLCHFPVSREAYEGASLFLDVKGLTGGHSGSEINKGRNNAHLLLGRILTGLHKVTDYRLVTLTGGSKDNAITPNASAGIVVKDAEAATVWVHSFEEFLKQECRVTDPQVEVTLEPASFEELPMDEKTTDHIRAFLTCVPQGVQVMSAEMPGLVQTSLNFGILKLEKDEMTGGLLVRSSVDSQKEMLVDRVETLVTALGGTMERSGDYPGWTYEPKSPLRDLLVEVYREQYGKDPVVEAIHAGVECGLLAHKLPGLDCVSLGPTLTGVHTPKEKMSIASVQRTWKLLLETLRRMK